LISSHSGLVLLNKPKGITSFRVLGSLKKRINSGKVGHTGTLDKFAEGLMLVLTGKMTKLAPFFTNMDKEYKAVFKFGEETDTLDPEGKIIFSSTLPSLKDINSQINKFTGNIMQVPPNFSAIHINGERAYKLAVKGKKPVLQERPVSVYNYEIKKWEPPYLHVKVNCSKGTYIRSLARDLGRSVSSRAYVHELQRTKVGVWNVENSVLPENIDPDKDILSGKNLFKQINSINIYDVNNVQAGKILNGFPIIKWMEKGNILLNGYTAIFNNNNFLALVLKKDDNLLYKFVQDRT